MKGVDDNIHILAKWFAEARGEVALKTFPIFIRFNDKIWLFPPKIEVFVLRNQKANLQSVMES